MTDKYEAVIGLEIHAQLLTETKIFCRCINVYGATPNSKTCPVCLGLPGTLPVLNRTAVEFALRMGLATGSKISKYSRFARKNYFYPDLPKGYQISQYDEPLCYGGEISIRVNGEEKWIGITRIHLEEDAGKSTHDTGELGDTLVDFNRCGVPLIEIVSEPDIRSPQEAYEYLIKLKQILEYLEICNCNMEEGSLRCDANISVRLKGTEEFGVKTEMKNMNSFHGVEKALKFEIDRQSKVLDQGGKILQQTLLWDENSEVARPMRTKEESDDYRYFPEPDLVPLVIDECWIDNIKNNLPELPDEKYKKFLKKYKLRPYDADILTSNSHLADYFEEVSKISEDPSLANKWTQSEILRILKETDTDILNIPISPGRMGELLKMIKGGKITTTVGKDIFDKMLKSGEYPQVIVEKYGLSQISSESELKNIVKAIIAENAKEVENYKAGKKALFGFFMGQVMKRTKGKANPQLTSKLLIELLSK